MPIQPPAMVDTGQDAADSIIDEDRLKQISRSIRSFLPSRLETADASLKQEVKDLKTLLDRVFNTSSATNLTVTHRVAAWNTLCSLIDQSLESGLPIVRESIWVDGIWNRAFELYVQHAQSARPKSSRQLLATLTSCLKKSTERDLSVVKNDAVRQLVSALLNYEDVSSAKVSAQLLSHMLSKDVVSTYAIFRAFSRQSSSETGEFLLVLFHWLNRGDFGSTIAHLVSVFLDKSETSTGTAGEQPIWASPLRAAFINGAANTDALRAHVLPMLFKRNFRHFVSFLQGQGLDSLLSGSQANTNELLYVALQTGKELGLVEETDEHSMSLSENHLRIPLSAISNMMFHASRPTRVTGLFLLVTSHATTRPFSRNALRLIQKALDTVFADVDADFRGDVFSAFQQLVDRCRSITATLARVVPNGHDGPGVAAYKCQSSREQLCAHRHFLQWLHKFLCWQLRPTASYQRHISALKCLTVLAKSGLDGSIPRLHYSKSALSGAKWPFHIQIITNDMQRLLLDLVLDPFDDVRLTASSILGLACSGMDDESRSNLAPVIRRAENTMLATGRADHADGVAHLHALETRARDSASESSQQATVERLLNQLEQMLGVARSSLAEAVAEYPMHGLLTSIRYVLGQTKAMEENSNSRIYDDLNQVWKIVKPVLCNDAPEGYTTDQAEEGLDSTKETLSYCWRALKEASLLMSYLVFTQQVQGQELQDISNLCFQQLAELRHRGAFSTVAQTWMTCCMQCTSTNSSMGVPMLVVWYTKILGMLRRNVTINTRRSAGIPSLLCGTLIADKSGKLFASAMADLEVISRHPVDAVSAEEGSLPQVHAMNCLKDVLKNTRLGEQSERYVPTALQLAADALRSDVWAIRNCGLMLFRAVIDRLLGTDQSHFDDEYAAQKLISIHQHPQLIDVILDLLSNSNNVQTGLSTGFEGVFPALQLLQHIHVPIFRLDAVERAVKGLTASASWHIRDKAAHSLAALMAREPPAEALGSIHSLLLATKSSQNALHGALLTALHYLVRLKLAAERSDEMSTQIYTLFSDDLALRQGFVAEMWSVSRGSGCSVTQAAALDVIRVFAELSATVESDAIQIGTGEVKEISSLQNFKEPSSATLRQAAARLMAQRRSCANMSIPDEDAAAYVQCAMNLARQDQNACEHFFRSLSLPQFGSSGLGGGIVYSMCAELLHSEVGIHLKCEAQRVLLEVPPNDWRERIRMTETSVDPRLYLSEHDCNQRYADQSLQIRAIELDLRANDAAEDVSNVLPDIASWVDDSVAAIDGEGLHSREAAAFAINRIDGLWQIMARNPNLHDRFVQLCIAVYDLLNDDDEDTRLLAAAVTQRILTVGGTDEAADMEPITASRKLLAFIVRRWPSSTMLAETAFKRAFDLPFVPPESISDQLQALSHGDTALFVEEKQNLYIDEASEGRAWARVLQMLSKGGISQQSVKHLGTWVLDGLQTFARHAVEHPDGALGWSSKPDVFKLVLQVIYGADVLLCMVQRGVRLPVRPSEIRKQLFGCLTAFEKAEIVCLLRWEIRRVLSDAVVRKLSLVRESMLGLEWAK